MPIRDVQSEAIEALQALLGPIAKVEEGDVRTIFDAEDAEFPEEFIVLQPGSTEELVGEPQSRVPNSLREQVVINIVAVTSKRQYAAPLRAMRLAIKSATAGMHAGIRVAGVQYASFQTETPMPPGEGRRWACHVMPLRVTYVQPLK